MRLAPTPSAWLQAALLAASLAWPVSAVVAGRDAGPTPDIPVGQTMPYSGPVSALSTVGRAETAYLDMINAQGGVGGRKVRLISLDDGYSPPKTLEQTRKLVEEEQVLLIFGSQGTAPNTAIHKYLNAKRIPHLFLASSSSRWNDPAHFPWTMTGVRPTFDQEAHVYAQYVLRTHPAARIGVLYQNDEFGKDYLKGLRAGLGPRASAMIVAEQSYEVTDATVDSQVVALKAAGADVFLNVSTAKFGAQAIRKAFDIGWRPIHIVSFASSGVATVLEPAGLEKCVGLISSAVAKDPADPQWRDDPGMRAYLDWMRKYYPQGDPNDWSNVAGYLSAQLLVQTLRQAGDDLSRENVMRQAANLKGVSFDMLLPGIRIDTSPSDYLPVEQLQLMRFDGTRWVRFGDLIGGRR